MKTYYCTQEFTPGVTCVHRSLDGRCMGGMLCSCTWKSTTQPFTMPPVNPHKRKSSDCTYCRHTATCKFKNKFNRLKDENYPLVCDCVHYEVKNPLLEV